MTSRAVRPRRCLIGAHGAQQSRVRLSRSIRVATQHPLLIAPRICPKVSIEDIHDGTSILAYYILTMVFAEAALFLMAVREWRPSRP